MYPIRNGNLKKIAISFPELGSGSGLLTGWMAFNDLDLDLNVRRSMYVLLKPLYPPTHKVN